MEAQFLRHVAVAAAAAAAAGICFLRAFLGPVLYRLWKHQEEGETFHVPFLVPQVLLAKYTP